jgi:S-adenosylmethionine:tRNA ribosyltransferase-isomerase
MTRLVTRTQLLIAPGYRFRVARGLVTNFHQPRSTLLLLIAAWMGDAWKAMYRHALDGGYRVLSYGDGCLLGPPVAGPADR